MENPDIKVEEEDVKYEDENGIHLPDTCSTLEVQMIESEESSRGPVRNNEARLKYEPPLSGSAGGTPLRPPVTQHYSTHPQSFEEIVSQALPGPSGIQGVSNLPLPYEFVISHIDLSWFSLKDSRLSTSYFTLYPSPLLLEDKGMLLSAWSLGKWQKRVTDSNEVVKNKLSKSDITSTPNVNKFAL